HRDRRRSLSGDVPDLGPAEPGAAPPEARAPGGERGVKRSARPINFLPGPVAIHAAVLRALGRPPVSPRGAGFMAEVAAIRRDLCRRTGAAHVEILLGSGTLGNEAVGAPLALRPGRGLVLVNRGVGGG